MSETQNSTSRSGYRSTCPTCDPGGKEGPIPAPEQGQQAHGAPRPWCFVMLDRDVYVHYGTLQEIKITVCKRNCQLCFTESICK